MPKGNPGKTKSLESIKKISEVIKNKREFIKKHGKFLIIPVVCNCDRSDCRKILWNGSNYVLGHNPQDHIWCKGLKLTPKHIENLRISHTGHKDSVETKLKKSKSASGKNNAFFGKKHTEEFKESRRGKKNPRYGKTPSHGKKYPYDSPLQGRIYLNNSWEVNYVQYLDENNILWLYEMETFELSGEKCYTPDFFLPKYEKFVEIKGWMRPRDQENIDKFREEYTFELEVLQKKDLRNLGIRLGEKYIKIKDS